MVQIKIFRNDNNKIYGCEIRKHTDNIVCAAVSILALNLANSIETFTDEKFLLDFKEEGGYFHLEIENLKQGKEAKDAELLLNSFKLGIDGIKAEYGKYIRIID